MRIHTLTIPAVALGLMLSAAPAHAQWGDLGRIFGGQGRSYGDARQIAHDNGYREGLNHGGDAARDNRPFDLQREKDYRNADEGYRREYGDKDRYRDEFRRGFAEGYREAYERYGRNGGSYGGRYPDTYPNTYPNTYPTYPSGRDRDDGRVYGGTYDPRYGNRGGYGYGAQAAYQNGVNDGYEKGQNDARDRKAPDPRRQKWYRSGDRRYDNDLGISRDEYRNEYRRGFLDGYDRAYRDRRW